MQRRTTPFLWVQMEKKMVAVSDLALIHLWPSFAFSRHFTTKSEITAASPIERRDFFIFGRSVRSGEHLGDRSLSSDPVQHFCRDLSIREPLLQTSDGAHCQC